MQKQNSLADYILRYGITSILVLVPFHAFLTAWIASNYGNFDLIRLWKEFILAGLILAAGVTLSKKHRLRDELGSSWLFRAIAAFCIWTMTMAAVGVWQGNVGWAAAAYGLIIDTRILLFFIVCYIASRTLKLPAWNYLIILPAAVVIIFGLLQLVLPADFLRHFGYGSDTLKAFQTVDNQPELVRLQSTLRGPNPLGAYLVIAIVILISNLKQASLKWKLLLAGSLVVLYGTYSRSAWLGLGTAVFSFGLLSIKEAKRRRQFVIGVLIFSFVGLIGVYALRNNDTVQNAIFHSSEQSTASTSSNEERLNSLSNGFKEAVDSPLGEGVGAAGPASTRNTKRPSHINENFFLQITEEIGFIGIGLFIAILAMMGILLWKRRNEVEARVLLSLMAGTAVINMVSHAWADDTLAYILFGLIGLYLGTKKSTKSEKNLYT